MRLRVRDLAVSRGGLPVLEGLSFDLAPGSAVILRGPNGAGKTTLLRTLAGLQPALRGSIEPGAEAVAYAAHADGLKPTLSVTETLAFWAGVYGAPGIGPALEAFELEPLARRAAGTLSAGQKRRLGLARLILTGRPVWALDEPTVSLDAGAVALFAAAVRAHLAGGGAAVIATHIDLSLEGEVLDIGAFRAAMPRGGAFDDSFDGALA